MTTRERDAARNKQWRRDNPEKVKAQKKRSHARNKATNNARCRAWHKVNRARVRLSRWRRKYGVTEERAKELLAACRNLCSICGGEGIGRQGLVLDHNHTTNKVRGVLCTKCNTAIGMLDDLPERCEAAAAYLRERV